jgi:hypothetical protein
MSMETALREMVEATRSAVSPDAPCLNRRRTLLGLSGVAAGVVLGHGKPGRASAQEVTPRDSPAACGVNFIQESGSRISNGTNCRRCPSTNSTSEVVIPAGQRISYRGRTTQGGPGGSVWYQTSGSVQCWVAQSATRPG